MTPDLYVFRAKGDSPYKLRTLRLEGIYPNDWISPRLVLAATKGSGGFRLLFLCGRDQEGRLCSEYPVEVDEIYASYNPGNLERQNPCDVAGHLVHHGIIDEVTLDADGRCNGHKPMTLVVTVTDHGDTCDGHARKLGVVAYRNNADILIEEDKTSFRKMIGDADKSHYTDNPDEIWWDDTNGRTYDVIVL